MQTVDMLERACSAARANGYVKGLAMAMKILSEKGLDGIASYRAIAHHSQIVPDRLPLTCEFPDAPKA